MSEPHSHSRHDGFTPDRQAVFLDTLAASGSVSAAAHAAGVSRTAVYNLRNREGTEADAFRVAWDECLRQAVAVLAETAFDRAINGVEEPILYKGEPVGTRIRHNDRLLMFLLKALDPETYARTPDARPTPSRARPAIVSTLSTSGDRDPVAAHPASVSTSSTALETAEAEEEMSDVEFRMRLRELRGGPELPSTLSKRNARRLAARQRAANAHLDRLHMAT
jgi:hypothetical protein